MNKRANSMDCLFLEFDIICDFTGFYECHNDNFQNKLGTESSRIK